ncbi:trimeric intracellular cation channel family protein [Hazenella coriacea]|uniref:Putative membrane protein YeiH n=1 Tax=Hazenella coriacea TaxID=1179467 RepID=A0A4R3L4T2_9BACL|nr:trimeric intracellular cation channel family protein [Hazenella coriacea]TCS93144.1 putative membrane protein YeiH [Hazenella coriacea]
MTWDLLNALGIAAFAVSGALIAIEEKYDIFGIYVLGFVTAFGGGIIRNVLIGLPVSMLWEQEIFIYIALFAVTLISMSPSLWLQSVKKWLDFFDAIGLAAFSIQGALFAVKTEMPLVAVIVASVLTGIGGGIVRDLLAGRKPLVFHKEVYALWAILSGIVIGCNLVSEAWEYYIVFVLVVTLRMLSTFYEWKLPGRLVRERKTARLFR